MSEIMKEYTLKEITDLSKNYSLVCIQNGNGKKLVSWTPSTKKISVHIKECIDRIQLEIYPDGFYFFCMAQNRNGTKDNYDKYLYKKGNPQTETLHHPINDHKTPNGTENILSITSALGYIQKIAELTTEVNSLKAEVTRLKDENAVLDAELEQAENEGLSDNNKQGEVLSYLKETSPTILGALDRFFELQDKKLGLEERKLNKFGTLKKVEIKRPAKRPDVVTGSDDHLNLIRKLYADKNEPLLNRELDILEKESPEKYENICIELNLFEDESGN